MVNAISLLTLSRYTDISAHPVTRTQRVSIFLHYTIPAGQVVPTHGIGIPVPFRATEHGRLRRPERLITVHAHFAFPKEMQNVHEL